ncbi:MAG: adenylyltransferase/cytidyltransferase family protein [Planctomycetota bacterium]
MTARIVPDYRALAVELAAARNGEPRARVVLANGCFDVLHVGHVRLLREARAHGDLLVVALNSDASVARNKGAGRPAVPLIERLEVMAALAGVDYVTSFDEPTAHELIDALRPDVHAKGTDWTADAVPERAAVERWGGRVAICGDPKAHSSTSLIQRLNADE